MPFSAGDKLGPYEILAPIGKGGMGEVWKARDPRLDRIVAIKVSSKQFGERFEIEARAVAALNHPHICQLYDVGPNYLVMEFVDGAPLRGPLPLERAVYYAAQILEALDAAHQKGITHRDLKPDNILVTKLGIKLLDFGLAKRQIALKETEATLTRALTQDGQILGTFQYMSPEQLQGKEVDSRSDLFSFGCLLYEMLTGKRAFGGTSAAGVIGAILEREPECLTIAPSLERIVRRALAKDPDQRFQTARDLKASLLWAMEHPADSAAKRSRVPWIPITAATLVIGAIGVWAMSHFTQPFAGETIRLAINAPATTVFSGPPITVPTPQFAISPDGRKVVLFAAPPGGRSILWMRAMNDVTARPIPHTENGSSPFWSPDGKSIGFFVEGTLRTIPTEGGPAQTLVRNTNNDRGASWGADDRILFGTGNNGLSIIAAAPGATVIPVTKLEEARQEVSHRWPQFLPDGRHFLYLIRSKLPKYQGIYAGSLDGITKKRLLPIDSNVFYLAPGYLLYSEADVLMARPFDLGSLELSGQPIVVAEGVGKSSTGHGAFSVSRSGVLGYAGPILRGTRLTWLDHDGKSLNKPTFEGDYADFRLSRDEKRLAAALLDPKTGNADIWLTDLGRGPSRFTVGPTVNASATWSPNGAWLAYRSVRSGVAELYQRSTSGGGSDSRILSEAMQRSLLPEANNLAPTDWSPDGKHLLFSVHVSNEQLWMLPLASAGGDGKPFQYIVSSADHMHGNFSPNGDLVAYTSNESGRFEVWVQTFPLSERKKQVSTSGGSEPRWRADGHELYYLSEDRMLMAVSVEPGRPFGNPKPLFQMRVPPGVNPQRMNYVPAKDGQSFLVNSQASDSPPNPITVVLNWTSGLKK